MSSGTGRYKKEMSRRTRSSSSNAASPPPTLDLTRRPMAIRNSDSLESSSMPSVYESPSPSPVDQNSRNSISEQRNSISEPRKRAASRVSEELSNRRSSWAFSNSNLSFPIASETPPSPSPLRSTSSTEALLVSSSTSSFASSLISADKNQYGFHNNPEFNQQINTWVTSSKDDRFNEYASYRNGVKHEIVEEEEEEEEEEKIMPITRSSRGSTDGSSVKTNSYSVGRSVRTRNRKFLTCEPSTVSASSSTTDHYQDSNSVLSSPVVPTDRDYIEFGDEFLEEEKKILNATSAHITEFLVLRRDEDTLLGMFEKASEEEKAILQNFVSAKRAEVENLKRTMEVLICKSKSIIELKISAADQLNFTRFLRYRSGSTVSASGSTSNHYQDSNSVLSSTDRDEQAILKDIELLIVEHDDLTASYAQEEKDFLKLRALSTLSSAEEEQFQEFLARKRENCEMVEQSVRVKLLELGKFFDLRVKITEKLIAELKQSGMGRVLAGNFRRNQRPGQTGISGMLGTLQKFKSLFF